MTPFLINCLTICLAAALIRRNAWKAYPFFCVYIFFSIVDSIALLLVQKHYLVFFIGYWSSQVVYSVLSLLALQDVFRDIFRSFYGLFQWFWMIFPGAIVTFFLTSICFVILHPPTEAVGLARVVLSFGLIDGYIRLGLFWLFLVLMTLLGIRRRSYGFGIIEGFTALALGDLLGFGLRYTFGTHYNTLVTYASPAGFLCAVILWLSAFLRPPAPAVVHYGEELATPEQLLIRIKARTGSLNRLLWKPHIS